MSETDPLKPSPVPAPLYYPAPVQATAIKPVPRWVWIASAIAVVCLIAAAIPIYKIVRTQWRKADAYIAPLHAKMIQGDDAGIFAESDPAYQQSVGLEKSNHLFDYVREQLGAPRSSTCIGQNISAKTGEGSILTLTFSTVFDKGTGTERVSLHKLNGVYRMVGYNVQSPQIPQSHIPSELKTKAK
jgi:hypothetical protein